MVVALLAMAGEPIGRTRMREHLLEAGIGYDDDQLAHDLPKLHALGIIHEHPHRGWSAQQELTWPAIKAALASDHFGKLALAYTTLTPLRRNWEGYAILR
eukprot:gene15781-33303_t